MPRELPVLIFSGSCRDGPTSHTREPRSPLSPGNWRCVCRDAWCRCGLLNEMLQVDIFLVCIKSVLFVMVEDAYIYS